MAKCRPLLFRVSLRKSFIHSVEICLQYTKYQALSSSRVIVLWIPTDQVILSVALKLTPQTYETQGLYSMSVSSVQFYCKFL